MINKQIQQEIKIYSIPWGGSGWIEDCRGHIIIDIPYAEATNILKTFKEDRPLLLDLIGTKIQELLSHIMETNSDASR